MTLFTTSFSEQNICPFCRGLNQCSPNSEIACWCKDVPIPSALIDLLPAHLKRKSCICVSCVTAYNNDEQGFKANLEQLRLSKEIN